MARQLKRLTTRTVTALAKIGRHADGGNLYLTISKTDSGLSKRWTFMFAIDGKQREAGFGSASIVTLAEAREKAAEYRSMLAKGIDPLSAKQAAREAAAARRTFGQCADELIKSKRREWRSEKHAGQWRKTVTEYCGPIWDVPVDAIDTQAILSILQPIWETILETASRLRGRIEAVLDYGKAHGLRSGENPAAWRGHLALILPRRQKLSKGHHAALPYRDVPTFVGKLREQEAIQTLALEFCILTAARSGEVLGARWDEFDLEGKVWVIRASRMKAALSIGFRCLRVRSKSPNAWPRSGAGILSFLANAAGSRSVTHPCGGFVPMPEQCTGSGHRFAIGAAKKPISREN